MKYCTKCGTQLTDEAKFCANCGAQQQVSLAKEPPLQTSGDFNDRIHQTNPNVQSFNPPSTPTLRFIWPKAESYIMLLTITPWISNLNVEINGRIMTPSNGVKFKDGFVVDFPVSKSNKIEIWQTNFLIKNKMSPSTRVIDLNLDPSYSYILEIKNPLLYYWLGISLKYRVKDVNGNILFEG